MAIEKVTLPNMHFLKLIENRKKFRDNHGYSSVVLIDLSKACDTIDYDLLIAKHAYGIKGTSL